MSGRVPAFVTDASIILKWVLDAESEPGHAAARRFLDRWQQGEIDLLVPPLWLYEVGNTLCRKRPEDAFTVLSTLSALGLGEVAFSLALVQRTTTLAQSYGLTFYDASYLAVALERGAVLVTADSKFCRRLPSDLPVELLE